MAPNFITSFILRSPEEIDSSGSIYELSPLAGFIPISALIMILAHLCEEFVLGKNELGLLAEVAEISEEDEEAPVTETTKLFASKRASRQRRKSSIVEINQCFSTKYERDRRSSVEANGIINPFETRDEIILRNELLEDKKEWDELTRLDAAMEEEDREVEME